MFIDSDRLWVLLAKKKSGEASVGELRELDALVASQNVSTEVVDAAWEARMQPVDGSFANVYGWSRILKKIGDRSIGQTHRWPSRRSWLAAASVLVLTGCFGIFYFLFSARPSALSASSAKKDNEFITHAGSKSTLQLPDGTRVWLNANSRITYRDGEFGVRSRDIQLTGEAFFDVTRNEKVPFIVHSGPVTITVKGTAFNVKAYPGQRTVETALVRGRIEITTKHDPDRKIIVKPDEKVVIPVDEASADSSKMISRQPADRPVYSITSLHKGKSEVIPETVWMQSKLEFDDEPFSELAPKMEEWFNISITLADEQIKAKRFTGVIEKETIKETLRAMQLSYPFRYEWKGTQLNISK